MRHLLRFLLLAVCFGSAAFAQTAPKGEHALGPGDVIRISVYQNPDLSLETRLSESGEISFPLIGVVKLGGLTLPRAQQRIAKALLDGKYVIRPQVNIQLVEIRSSQISVLGQVGRPGRYPIEAAGSRVSEMIAKAGGGAPGGSDVVTLVGTRDGQQVKYSIDLPAVLQAGRRESDVVVANGDIIYVDRAPILYVYGEVGRPGQTRLDSGMTVRQVIASAGGVTDRGTLRGLRIHRRDPDGTLRVIEPKLDDLVERDDVIYVKESLF
mgnify:CR=1 FL=1